MEKATAVKIGDPAGAFTLQHAADALAHAYSEHGFLDAKATHVFPKDASAHTVDLTFTVIPGEIYHLAAVDVSAYPPEAQAAIARDSKLQPGVVADQDAIREIEQVLAHQPRAPGGRFSMKEDREHHLATITVTPTSPKH